MKYLPTILIFAALLTACNKPNQPAIKGFIDLNKPSINQGSSTDTTVSTPNPPAAAATPTTTTTTATPTTVTTDSCTSTAPINPTGILLTTSTTPNKISLTWTNPSNCKLKGVLIKRKIGSIPSDINDGTTISANSDNASMDDTTVSTTTLYYYKVFLYNDADQYSTGTIASGMLGTTSIIQTVVANNSIVIDGQENDTAWSSTPKINFSFPVVPTFTDYTGGADLNVTGYIRFAYDTNNFYIFIHSDDKLLRVDNAGAPWTDDSIEVFFDFGFNRTTTPDTNDFHAIITPRSGASYEGYWKGTGAAWGAWTPTITRSNYTTGCTLNTDGDTDAGWNMEIQIPFSDLGIAGITAGQVIGFTFWVNDDDLVGGSGTQHYFPWTTGTASTNPSTWGILQF